MNATTHTYSFNNQEATVYGFIASLLQQGDAWDYRCIEADMQDYHQQHYARMDSREALIQEIHWWIDAYQTELLHTHPEIKYLLSEGVYYLFDCARELLKPDSDTDKLTTDMAIFLDEDNHLFKMNEDLCLIPKHRQPDFDTLIHGFPAQLLTYAACTTIEDMMDNQELDDPLQWVNIILDWLESPPIIYLRHIRFDIPNVYSLYASFLEEEKRKWEVKNQKHYQSTLPQFRSHIASLIQETQYEAEQAVKILSPYMSEKQCRAYQRYLCECQQYLSDHSQTRSKGRSYSLDKYWCPNVEDYIKQASVRKIKSAVKSEQPAAALAHLAKRLQQDGVLISELRPLTHFVATVNRVCNANIKHDSFSKHFR